MTRTLSLKINSNATNRALTGGAEMRVAVFTDQYNFHHVVAASDFRRPRMCNEYRVQ